MSKERFIERHADVRASAARLMEAVAQPVRVLDRRLVPLNAQLPTLNFPMNTPDLREKDLAALRATFRRFPCVREVRVFGSRATGHARRASDLDLAISAPDATAGEWLELAEALDDAPLIYELDLVRAEQTTNARLREKIAREGVPIYPAEMPKTGAQ